MGIRLSALLGAALLCAVGEAGAQATPPVRLRSRIEAMLGPVDTAGLANPKPLNIVWVTSSPAEGTDYHNFDAQAEIWRPLFSASKGVAFATAQKWPSPAQWAAADVVIFNFRHGINSPLSDAQYADMDGFLARGKALIPVHVGVALQDFLPKRYAQYIGLSWQWKATGDDDSHDRRGRVYAGVHRGHALAARLPDTLEFEEEIYYNLYGDTSRINILAASPETFSANGGPVKTTPSPVFWTKSTGNGKVFASVLGHYTRTYSDPLFRLVFLRGLAWAAGQNPDRFRDLVLKGADYQDDVAAKLARAPEGTSSDGEAGWIRLGPGASIRIPGAAAIRPDGRRLGP